MTTSVIISWERCSIFQNSDLFHNNCLAYNFISFTSPKYWTSASTKCKNSQQKHVKVFSRVARGEMSHGGNWTTHGVKWASAGVKWAKFYFTLNKWLNIIHQLGGWLYSLSFMNLSHFLLPSSTYIQICFLFHFLLSKFACVCDFRTYFLPTIVFCFPCPTFIILCDSRLLKFTSKV